MLIKGPRGTFIMDLLPPGHATHHHPTRHWADDSDELRQKNLPVSNDYLLALAM